MSRAGNAERIVKEGYRFLMMAPVQSYGHFTAGAESHRAERKARR